MQMRELSLDDKRCVLFWMNRSEPLCLNLRMKLGTELSFERVEQLLYGLEASSLLMSCYVDGVHEVSKSRSLHNPNSRGWLIGAAYPVIGAGKFWNGPLAGH